MLSVAKQPSNPNTTTASNTTKWVKDEYLQQLGSVLNNLPLIPEKDLKITNKSIEDYKNASKLEIMSEIIATWNLTQFNVLSGIKNVLQLNDRILHITADRNNLIGQCMKRLNHLEHINFLRETNNKPNDKINNIANLRMKKNKIKPTFETIQTKQAIQNIDMNKNKTKSTIEPILTQNTNESIPTQHTNKISPIKSQSKEQAIQNINTNLCDKNDPKIKQQSQSHDTLQNMETLPNMNRKANPNENNSKLIKKKSNIAKTKRKINPTKTNRKRNGNLNHRKKKKYKNKKKYVKIKQKTKPMKRIWNMEKIPNEGLSNAEFFAQPVHKIDLAEADRRMAIHLAKNNIQYNYNDDDADFKD